MGRSCRKVVGLGGFAFGDPAENGIRETSRVRWCQGNGLSDRGVLGDVHEEQLIRAEPQNVEKQRVDLPFGELHDGVVKSRSPAKDPQDHGAHEARLFVQQGRGEGSVALDAAKKGEGALSVRSHDYLTLRG